MKVSRLPVITLGRIVKVRDMADKGAADVRNRLSKNTSRNYI